MKNKLFILALCTTLAISVNAYHDDYDNDYNDDETIGSGAGRVARGTGNVAKGTVEGAANILTLGGVSRAKERDKKEKQRKTYRTRKQRKQEKMEEEAMSASEPMEVETDEMMYEEME